MKKTKISPGAFLFPMPVVIIGANVDEKPNFEPLAYVGIIEYKPPIISIASYETHYTNIGIKENGTFSVNTPSEDIVDLMDYCGIVSGKEADKSEVFEIFYGDLGTAPMIVNSPLNLECKVIKTIDVKELIDIEMSHEIFIGSIVGVHAADDILTEGAPDIRKMKTFTYTQGYYWKIGEQHAKAWDVGKKHQK